MDNSVDAIKLNIAARENAEEAIEEIRGYAVGVNEDRFWECVATMAAARVGKVLTEDGPACPMNDEEAKRFECTKAKRGVYKGRRIRDVPLEHWASMADDPFLRKIRRYVQSNRFKRKVGLMSPNIEDTK